MTGGLAAPPALSEAVVATFLKSAYGLEGELLTLSGERDLNHLVTLGDERWVLKIAGPDEDHGHLNLQVSALRHLEKTAPELPLPRVRASLAGKDLEVLIDAEGRPCPARLVTYLPGRPIGAVPRATALLSGLGGFLAQLDRALAGFFHPAARPDLLWDVAQAPRLRPALERASDPDIRGLLIGVLDRAEAHVLPKLGHLRAQLIHMDATLDNVLVDAAAPERLAGLIDFGDMMHQPLVLEPALAGAELMLGAEDPLACLRDLVLGYDQVERLTEPEIEMVAELAALRLASTSLIVLGGHLGPLDETAVSRELTALETLERAGTASVTADLKAALHLPSAQTKLFQRRRKVTAPAYEHFYREPLHLVRGKGALVFDRAGRSYIDAYNNVPHVGHSHPRVVNAMLRQAERININTRYLTDSMVAYAERLTASLPPELSQCLFLSSGSEANDVAWRMAWAATGAKGALVMEGAYHGVTDLVARLSPCGLVQGEDDPPYLRRILAPYPLRAADRDPAAEAERALASIDQAIASLQESGQGVAGLMIDLGLTNNGVLDLPQGYLVEAVRRVKAAGGLFIADEVQAGFGRSGDSFWRFQPEGVTPDVVTMGKAIGNGIPLAVAVARDAVARAFSDKFYFFSSMGGNPVCCAAGLAVLDCLEEEGLQQHAQRLGTRLRAELLSLTHPLIAEVRGQGLLLGVELIKDGRSASVEAKALVERMREKGVLIGTEGPDGNVIKIRPPMVLSSDQAERILDAFDESLRSLA